MLFNSLEYLIFLPLVTLLYFLTPTRFRWALLLAASYYFYASWKVEYALLILFCTAVNYAAALIIEFLKDRRARAFVLTAALVLSFSVLFVFKYLAFFTQSINTLIAGLNLPTFEILLPVGISFFTFQTLSYTIDVYRGKVKAERHFGIFALFVSFFPQLVAGPIERSENLLPQFRLAKRYDAVKVTAGLKIILWGLFKKLIIADRLAIIVNSVYNSPNEGFWLTNIVATVAFAFQILCDFSAYSDIALGSAKIFGIDLMRNFDAPYFSKSIAEFWRRWHISLSSWFRDYVYIPLGGNRKGKARRYFNTMVTFTLSGLWHGANWTFVIWGALNGLYLCIGRALKPTRDKLSEATRLNRAPSLKKLLQVILTFSLTCFAWIFFRANTLEDAFIIISRTFTQGYLIENALAVFGDYINLIVASLGVIILVLTQFFARRKSPVRTLWFERRSVRFAGYLIILFSILMFGVTGNETAFIYFQF